MTGLVKILVIFCVISASVAAYNQTVRKQEFQDGFCDTDCQIEIEASIQYTSKITVVTLPPTQNSLIDSIPSLLHLFFSDF